jgi:hypothetical protein
MLEQMFGFVNPLMVEFARRLKAAGDLLADLEK